MDVKKPGTIELDYVPRQSEYGPALLRAADWLESPERLPKNPDQVAACARNIRSAVMGDDGDSAILFLVCGMLSVNSPARNMAHKRHSETRSLVEDALNYWRRHIDPNLSAAKAANTLMGVVPLSHKKLAAVVSAEKKKPA